MATIANDTQFIGISPTIDLTGKKSAILNEQTIPVTMDDITSTVRPYNVFTALLTQNGGDDQSYVENFTTVGSTQNIVKGVTYYIDVNADNVDFSSIGAPSNAEGTYFIATENKINTDFPNLTWALGYNTGAPVATVLENTIGNVWFTYGNVGSYSVESNGLFIENKSWMNTAILLGVAGPAYRGTMSFNTQNILSINTESDVDTASNNLLYNIPIEIRVYE